MPNSTSGGRLGGSAPKSIGKHYNQAERQVPSAMKSNFNQGQAMANSRKHPTDKNADRSRHTS